MTNKPFEGDELIGWAIKGLIDRWMPSAIIETGTEHGATALALRKFGLTTFTIERMPKLFIENHYALAEGGVIPLCGPSWLLLPGLCRLYNRLLFYLDAHDMEGTCVRSELAAIAQCRKPPVIVVHDVKVPDAPDLGWDKYTDGTELTFEYFADLLPAIYPEGFNHRFNKEAYGARRGCCFITPKDSE